MGFVHLLVSRMTNGRLTHPATRVFTILSFGKIICSPLELRPEFIESKEKGIAGNLPVATSADQTTNGLLGQSDWQKLQNENLNNIHPRLDTRPIELAMAKKERGPFFWIENLYNLQVDEKRISLEPRGKEIDEVGKTDIVQSLRMEYLLLKKRLWSCRKKLLGVDLVRKTKENAHKILEDYLDNHTTMILGYFIGKTHQLKVEQSNSLVEDVPEEIKWKILVSHFQNQLLEFEDLLSQLKLTKSHSDFEKEGRSIFIVKLFNMINCLVKYGLVKESYFKSWINKPKVLSLLADHINKAMYEISVFFSTDIREELHKSKLSQHLVPSLNSLSETGWKFIEEMNLTMKTEYLINIEERKRPHNLVINFSLGLQDIENLKDKNETSAAKFIKLIQHIIFYLEWNPYCRIRINNYHTYGLLYQIIHFIMRYYPYELTEALGNEEHARVFFIRIHILKLALNLMKISDGVKFVGNSGYWTTEEDSLNSKHLISFEQIQNWNFVPDLENKYFMEMFSGELPGEKNEISQKFKQFSVARDGSEGKKLFCVSNTYEFKFLPERLGTNFSILPKGWKKSLEEPSQPPSERKISTLFLRDSYSWIQKLEFVLKTFRIKQDMYSEILKKVLSANVEIIPQDVKRWVMNGNMMRTVHHQIYDAMEDAEFFWKALKERLEVINQEILKSSPFQNTQIQKVASSKEKGKSLSEVFDRALGTHTCSENTFQEPNSQLKGLLYIPELEFSRKPPTYSVGW